MREVNGIRKGDFVAVNREYCYINYSQFIKRHLQYAIRWAYKCYPDEGHEFVVKGIYRHVMHDKYDNSKFCIVIQDCITKQIFLSGDYGLKKIVSI